MHGRSITNHINNHYAMKHKLHIAGKEVDLSLPAVDILADILVPLIHAIRILWCWQMIILNSMKGPVDSPSSVPYPLTTMEPCPDALVISMPPLSAVSLNLNLSLTLYPGKHLSPVHSFRGVSAGMFRWEPLPISIGI